MKRITSLAIVLTLLLGSITTVFAADLDLINQVDDSKNFSWNEFVRVSTNLRYVGENIDDYLIEFEEQFYRAAQVDAAIKAGAENFEEAIKELEPVEKPIEELEVVEVSAINDVNVAFGTPVEELELPEEIEVILSNEETDVANVEWNTESYDPELEGEQEIKGTLVVPEGKEWTIPEELLAVTVKVIVGEDTRVEVEKVETTVDNDNTVIVTFAEALAEDFDLTDKEIKVNDMVAKYVADSYDAKAKTAKFKLAEEEDKLEDAKEYTVTSDWAKDATFVARVVASYINEVEITTKDVPAVEYDSSNTETTTKIYFTAKNQYGEDIELTKESTANLKAKVRLNGVPLLDEEVVYTKGNDYIEIKKSLKKNDNLSIKVVNEIDEEEKVVGEKEFTVIKGEKPVATTIENLKAVYTEGENKDKEVTSLAAGDKVKLTVEVKDQYGNPMKDEKVRWVAEEGSKLIETEATQAADAVDFTFEAKEAGSIKIAAYLRNGENVVFEKEIGAARLTGITFKEETPKTKYNNEEIVLGTVKPNEGAVLTPDMIDFKVEPGKDLTKEDITVEAKLRKEVEEKPAEGTEDDIVVVAKTTKAGTYKITPFVVIDEKEVEAETAATLTTTINPNVAKIVIGELGDQVLTNGGNVKVDVTITNKHGEELTPSNVEDDEVYKVIESNPTFATGELKLEDVKDAEGKVIGKAVKLVITGNADEGKATLHIVNGSVESNRIEVEVNKASQPAELKALETIEVVEKAKKASLHKVEIKDQYGNVFDKIEGIKLEEVLEKDEKGEDKSAKLDSESLKLVYYTEDEDGNLTTSDEITKDNADGIAVQLKVADKATVKNGDVVKVKAMVGEGEEAKAIGELAVNLKEAAKLAKINVTPITETVTIGAKGSVKVDTIDQYGKFITHDLYLGTGENPTLTKVTDAKMLDKDGKETEDTKKAVAYKVEIDNLNTEGEVVVTVANGDDPEAEGFISDTATLTVKAAQDVIETVEIEEIGEVANNGESGTTDVTLKAIARDKDGNEVAVAEDDLVWEIVSAVDEEGKAVENSGAKIEKGKLTVNKGQTVTVKVSVMTSNGKEATTTIKFVNEEPKVTSDLKIEKVTMSLGEDIEEVEIKDNAIEIKEGDKVTLVLSAKDQYGKEVKDDNITIDKALTGNKNVATVEGKEITAEKEGNALITLTVGGQKVQLTVNVKANPELRATNAAAAAIKEVPTVTEESSLAAIATAMKATDKIKAADEAIAAAKALGVTDETIKAIDGYNDYIATKTLLEEIEEEEGIVDYNAVLNTDHADESIKDHYFIKVTVTGNLDSSSVSAIYSVDSEKDLNPDTDTVLWFRVASKDDTKTPLHEDGTYTYLVKTKDGKIYSFTHEFKFEKVQFPEDTTETTDA